MESWEGVKRCLLATLGGFVAAVVFMSLFLMVVAEINVLAGAITVPFTVYLAAGLPMIGLGFLMVRVLIGYQRGGISEKGLYGRAVASGIPAGVLLHVVLGMMNGGNDLFLWPLAAGTIAGMVVFGIGAVFCLDILQEWDD